jgi:GTPase involved in cell partitioning and DNA repair
MITHTNFDLIGTNARRQPRAGPDGGDGGHGGSIVLVADASFKELAHVKKHNKAGDGEGGNKNDCHGRNTSDLFIKVCKTFGLSIFADFSFSKF